MSEKMPVKVKIAAAQIEPRFTETGNNLDKIIHFSRQAADNLADLIVFPECCLTGYIFNSRAEAEPLAESIPGPSTGIIARLCQQLGTHIILGMLEKEGDKLFNSAVFIGPQGIIGKYHKKHLPFLGIDRFVDRCLKPFQVFNSPAGIIGMHICYDIVFPESSRVMALMGAEILALPTNFPEKRGEIISDHVVSSRAIENRVHVVSANRTGCERGFKFAGLSKIVNANGETLATASADTEEIIYAELNLETSRQKRLVIIPGEYEIDYNNDRRPDLYGIITKRHRSEQK